MMDCGAVFRRTPTAWKPNRTLGEDMGGLSQHEVAHRLGEVWRPPPFGGYDGGHRLPRLTSERCVARRITSGVIGERSARVRPRLRSQACRGRRSVDESDHWANDARRVTIYLSRLSIEITLK